MTPRRRSRRPGQPRQGNLFEPVLPKPSQSVFRSKPPISPRSTEHGQGSFSFGPEKNEKPRVPSMRGASKPVFGGKKPTTYEILSFDPGTSEKGARESITGLIAWCKKNEYARIECQAEDPRAIAILVKIGFHAERINTGGHGKEDMETVYVLRLR